MMGNEDEKHTIEFRVLEERIKGLKELMDQRFREVDTATKLAVHEREKEKGGSMNIIIIIIALASMVIGIINSLILFSKQ